MTDPISNLEEGSSVRTKLNAIIVLADASAPRASPTFTGTVVLPNDTVAYATIQNVSVTDRLLGRDTAAAGDIEELTVGGGVEFTGAAGIQRSALTGDVTAAAGANTTAIASGVVTLAKLADLAQALVIGRAAAAGTGVPVGLTAAQLKTILGISAAAETVLDDTTVAAMLATLGGLPLAGGTLVGPAVLGTSGSISDTGPISATGALTKATHGGRTVLTTGNVTIPNASGDVGMGGMIILGGAHTVTFNLTVTAALASGDVFCYYVQSTTVLKRTLVPSASQPAMT